MGNGVFFSYFLPLQLLKPRKGEPNIPFPKMRTKNTRESISWKLSKPGTEEKFSKCIWMHTHTLQKSCIQNYAFSPRRPLQACIEVRWDPYKNMGASGFAFCWYVGRAYCLFAPEAIKCCMQIFLEIHTASFVERENCNSRQFCWNHLVS